MAVAQRNSRLWWGIGVTVATFAWCVALSARADNDRWLKDLHTGHQSADFQRALAALNGRQSAERFDRCSVCHERRNWITNLVQPLAKVQDTSCRRCHEATPAAGTTPTAVLTSLGLPTLGERLGRPAHQGTHYVGKHPGLEISGNGNLSCSDCHADHQGTQLVDQNARANRRAAEQGTRTGGHAQIADKVAADRTKEGDNYKYTLRFRMTQACLACHLPRTPSAEATAVLKDFMDAHQSGNGFDPPMEDTPVQAIKSAPAGQPLDRGVQNRAVDAALASLKIQTNRREWKNDGSRGCTPVCHGEHTPALDDADQNKYRGKPGTASSAALDSVRLLALAPLTPR